MGRLDGKVAVITGATSGIGLRTPKFLSRRGRKFVVAAAAWWKRGIGQKARPCMPIPRTDVTVEEGRWPR